MCRDWGGTLFMPDSIQEIQFISDFLRNRRTWLGATDLEMEGLLKWDDGEECCFFNLFPQIYVSKVNAYHK